MLTVHTCTPLFDVRVQYNMMQPSIHLVEQTAPTKIKLSSPFLSIDHDGPWLVGVILQDHAHGVSVHPLDVDGVGCLTGPVHMAAVGVQAQVMKLVVHWLNTAACNHG